MTRTSPPIHRFESWQVWPGSFDNPPIDGSFPTPPARDFAITRATPIASMGSCFAREIKRRLVQRGFAYITEETDHPASVHASAAWERVYSTFCMRQIFEYTFDDRWSPALRWWRCPHSGRVQDPYRRSIHYESLAEAEDGFARHRACSRRAERRGASCFPASANVPTRCAGRWRWASAASTSSPRRSSIA